MVEAWVTITNRLGLHARAAAKLVRLAEGFKSSVHLHRPDQDAALAAVTAIFADGFGENG